MYYTEMLLHSHVFQCSQQQPKKQMCKDILGLEIPIKFYTFYGHKCYIYSDKLTTSGKYTHVEILTGNC